SGRIYVRPDRALRTALALRRAPTKATAAPATASVGAAVGWDSEGGNCACRTAAAPTAVAATASSPVWAAASAGCRQAQMLAPRPMAALATATSDQCTVHADSGPDTNPCDHGSTDSAKTTVKPTAATRSPVLETGTAIGRVGGAVSRTCERHSGPTTRPRTGVAQVRHSGRPHTSQSPTRATSG